MPLDFITTHTYTGGNDHINDATRVTDVLAKARSASGSLPLLITEFGSSYVPGRGNATTGTCHDTYEAASFLARVFDTVTKKGAGYDLDVLSYWAVRGADARRPMPTPAGPCQRAP